MKFWAEEGRGGGGGVLQWSGIPSIGSRLVPATYLLMVALESHVDLL